MASVFLLRPDDDVKPSTSLLLEEDEGFSDWSHRLEVPDQNRSMEQTPSEPQWKPEAVEEKFQMEQEEQEPFQEQRPAEKVRTEQFIAEHPAGRQTSDGTGMNHTGRILLLCFRRPAEKEPGRCLVPQSSCRRTAGHPTWWQAP